MPLLHAFGLHPTSLDEADWKPGVDAARKQEQQGKSARPHGGSPKVGRIPGRVYPLAMQRATRIRLNIYPRLMRRSYNTAGHTISGNFWGSS